MDKSTATNEIDSNGKALMSGATGAALWVNGTQDYR